MLPEGVSFDIKNHITHQHISFPKGFNNCLMTLKIPLRNKCNITLISTYSPTTTNPEEGKDKFYEELDSLITAVPKSNKLLFTWRFQCSSWKRHCSLGHSYMASKGRKMQQKALKVLCGPHSTWTSSLLSADGTTLIIEKHRILDIRSKHFKSMLNRQSIKKMKQMTVPIRWTSVMRWIPFPKKTRSRKLLASCQTASFWS